ncbi:MAG: DNA cytosine methyltransferase [Desulfurellales bacterium]|nr:MAG: DNA cytosine methyltransferase [Desulfurellales bacterium]
MKVLTINTYGGSLLLASRMAGCEIVGSCETDGYGVAVQRDNFPDVPIYPTTGTWPQVDLQQVAVIGHPPCACFSVQNNKRRTDPLLDPKFQATRDLLDYALSRKARAVMIESIAQSVPHTEAFFNNLARKYGYLFNRIEMNYSLWVPQNRKRVWSIWSRRTVDLSSLYYLTRSPRLSSVVKQDTVNYVSIIRNRVTAVAQKASLIGLDLSAYWNGKHGYGNLARLLTREKRFENLTSLEIARQLGVSQISRMPIVLEPNGVAPTLMYDSCWVYNGGLLCQEDYAAIMGFPREYKLRSGPSGGCLEYVSRGVVPAAAAWLLDRIQRSE